MPLKIKAREIDLQNKDHVAHLINEIELSENQNRKRKAWENFQCEAGNIKDFVKKELQDLYPETNSKFRVADISLCKKIVRKLAKAYKQSPTRELLKDDGTGSDDDTKLLQTIYDRDGFDRVWKEFDKLFNLHKYSCFWVPWVNPEEVEADEGHYSPQALAPFEYDLVRDQITGEPLIFILSFPDRFITGDTSFTDGIDTTITEQQGDEGAQIKKYSLWDKKNHVQVIAKLSLTDKDIKERVKVDFIEIPGNAENKNPIERLPIAFGTQDLSVDYPVPSNMGDQSVSWAVSFSDLKTAAAVQGHGQLVIKHPEGQDMKKVHMGMHTAIDLPQSKKPDVPETDAAYINPSPDLNGQLEVAKFDAVGILDDWGIKAKGTISGGVDDFSSGLDRLLSEADTQDVVEDNQAMFIDVEQEVYQVVKATEEALGKIRFKTEKLSTTYMKPTVLISDTETLNNIKQRDELGTLEQWEKLTMLDPNMSEEQAKEKLARIKAEKVQMVKDAQSMIDKVDQDPEKEEGDPNAEEGNNNED